MAKLRTSSNLVYLEKEYIDSQRFSVVSGEEYVDNGDVVFPYDPDFEVDFHDGRYPKEYWSHIGLRFHSNTQVYTCDNDGIRGAVRRLTCIRVPEDVGRHELLRCNQERFIKRNRGIRIWRRWFQEGMINKLSSIRLDSEEYRQEWTDAVHPKRELRRSARSAIIADGRRGRERVRRVDYKCKNKEILKKGKYLRAIGDLTAPGSTVGCYIMDIVKSVFAEDYRYRGGRCKYVKPSRETLLDNFNCLINPRENVYFNFFSDDSNCAVKCADGILRCNCDISACDGSNFDPVFNLLAEAMSVDDRYNVDIHYLFKQLEKSCVISSTQDKRKVGREKIRVQLKPRGKVLYSGSGLTTAVNNMANSLIFISFMNIYDPRDTKDIAIKKIEKAAANAGYILKCEVCDCIQKLQFLKYSPTERGGMYLNLGVVMRSFGLCKGDLPYVRERKKLSLVERGNLYIGDVIASHVHNGNSSIMRAMRETYQGGNVENLRKEVHVWQVGSQSEDLCEDSDLIARYDLTQQEIDELCMVIRNHKGPHIAKLTSCAKIFCTDYGY